MVRRVHVERARTTVRQGRDGVLHLQHPDRLPAYPTALTDRLVHWAHHAPGRTFVAERDGHGVWQHLTYARAFDRVLCLNRTQVAFGAPSEALTRAALEQTYGDEIVVLEDGGPGGPVRAVTVQHHHH